MFDQIKRVCKNARGIKQNKLIKEIFDDPVLQEDIALMNQEQMYTDGVDSRGNQLGEYSAVTKKIKQKKNQRTDHMTLKDTGEFYGSIKVKSESKNVIIKADMKKSDTDLEQRFPFALGLTDENLQKVKDRVLPVFKDFVLQDIFG